MFFFNHLFWKICKTVIQNKTQHNNNCNEGPHYLLINIFPLLNAISRLFLFSMNEMLLLYVLHEKTEKWETRNRREILNTKMNWTCSWQLATICRVWSLEKTTLLLVACTFNYTNTHTNMYRTHTYTHALGAWEDKLIVGLAEAFANEYFFALSLFVLIINKTIYAQLLTF